MDLRIWLVRCICPNFFRTRLISENLLHWNVSGLLKRFSAGYFEDEQSNLIRNTIPAEAQTSGSDQLHFRPHSPPRPVSCESSILSSSSRPTNISPLLCPF